MTGGATAACSCLSHGRRCPCLSRLRPASAYRLSRRRAVLHGVRRHSLSTGRTLGQPGGAIVARGRQIRQRAGLAGARHRRVHRAGDRPGVRHAGWWGLRLAIAAQIAIVVLVAGIVLVRGGHSLSRIRGSKAQATRDQALLAMAAHKGSITAEEAVNLAKTPALSTILANSSIQPVSSSVLPPPFEGEFPMRPNTVAAPLALVLLPLACLAQTKPGDPMPPKTWVDKDTGHRVWRLSDEPTPAPSTSTSMVLRRMTSKMVYSAPDGIHLLDLATRQTKLLVPNPPQPQAARRCGPARARSRNHPYTRRRPQDQQHLLPHPPTPTRSPRFTKPKPTPEPSTNWLSCLICPTPPAGRSSASMRMKPSSPEPTSKATTPASNTAPTCPRQPPAQPRRYGNPDTRVGPPSRARTISPPTRAP